ncbi:MAG: 4-hydroxy-tetrahydrodipicolinate reductase [Pseudomonadota bacterium]
MNQSRALRIALLGASGRMGQAVEVLVKSREGEQIIARWSEGDSDLAIGLTEVDVAVDFSAAVATPAIAAAVADAGIPLVSGTTGHSAAQRQALNQAGERVAVLHDGNMSLGIAVLSALAANAAALLPDYDLEIIETHHRHKLDAPSGTALKLSDALQQGRGINASVQSANRSGTRAHRDVGIASIRGGDVVGEHRVLLLGDDDQIELTHKAKDRRLFAAGALRAAHWLVDQPPGLYALKDVVSDQLRTQ